MAYTYAFHEKAQEQYNTRKLLDGIWITPKCKSFENFLVHGFSLLIMINLYAAMRHFLSATGWEKNVFIYGISGRKVYFCIEK